MSETDDTDELILIPPDIFAADLPEDPYLSEPYFEVVDTLISQVSKLENRIHSIEAKSETSLTSARKTRHLMSNVRKHHSSDDVSRDLRDVYYESTQSTPQKPQTRLRCSPSSSRTDQFSPHKFKFPSPSRKTTKQTRKDETRNVVLRDIDHYISNIENGFKETDKSDTKKDCLSLRDLDYMLRKIEDEEKLMSASDDQQNTNSEDRLGTESATSITLDTTSYTDITSLNSENLNSMRLNSEKLNSERLNSENHNSERLNSENLNSERLNSESSATSETTQLTAIPRRLPGGSDYVRDGMCQRVERAVARAQSYSSSSMTPPENVVNRKDYRKVRRCFDTDASTSKGTDSAATLSSESARMFSLSNLWRQGDYYTADMEREDDLFQRCEEEKVRRQHCEQIIQQLQTKVLELQERVAVAVQVDAAKDDAILRFHRAWEQVAGRLQSLTQERKHLEEEIRQMQEQHSADLADSAEKMECYESDAGKTAIVLQASQNKIRELEVLVIDMTNELKRMNTKCEDLNVELKNQNERGDILNKALQEKDEKLIEVSSALLTTTAEIKNEQKTIEALQSELKQVKEKQSKYEYMVKERDSLIETLEDQNQKLLNDMENHKKIEKELQKEVNKIKELSDQEKMDLKYFYQEQVERVVKDKLVDFQVQLEKARNELEDDLKKREVIVAKTAATHIQQIADKHTLEIKLLEEKHLEEVRLYQVQLGQTQQLIDNLQKRLQHQQHKKQDMAKQLHKLMEAQWLEALKIINNVKSPSTTNPEEYDLTKQLNLLKSQSYNNMEEMLSTDFMEDHPECFKNEPNLKTNVVPRMESKVVGGDTPLTSRPRQQIEEIQKYIHMLLHKQPGSPEQNGRNHQEIPTWQPQGQDESRQKSILKDRKLKPPWK